MRFDTKYLMLFFCDSLNIRWSDSNDIIVMEEVSVSPPYGTECARWYNKSPAVEQAQGNRTLDLVKKMVSYLLRLCSSFKIGMTWEY